MQFHYENAHRGEFHLFSVKGGAFFNAACNIKNINSQKLRKYMFINNRMTGHCMSYLHIG